MGNGNYDEKKIAEAKQKLACHIEPPAQRAHHDDDAAGQGAAGGQVDFIGADGRVLLTQMTSAGG